MKLKINSNPFKHLIKTLNVYNQECKYFDIASLDPAKYAKLPYSIRVLLESAVRKCDEFQVKKNDVDNILDWKVKKDEDVEVPFSPARVILQDLTGVPAIVDFAAMRDAFVKLGGDANKINPLCPAELVIDHSIQVDFSRANFSSSHMISENAGQNLRPNNGLKAGSTKLCDDCSKTGQCALLTNGLFNHHSVQQKPRDSGSNGFKGKKGKPKVAIKDPYADNKLRHETCPFHRLKSVGAQSLQRNQDLEFNRNKERFQFLKWSSKALKNTLIIPPGSGICHQVNLEYLARVVFKDEDNFLYPDSCVGLDSHTTMINGLGVVGWGVGGIEAEAVMLGQTVNFVLPQVIGYKLVGKLPSYATSTDLVLTITKNLRQVGVVGKFVEFFGPGVSELSIADRGTIGNMCPEYGATVGFFPVDEMVLKYLIQTGRDDKLIGYVEAYLKKVNMFRTDFNNAKEDPVFSEVFELDLSSITPSLSGPKRPHDRVSVSDMKTDFSQCLVNKVGFKGFGLPSDKLATKVPFIFDGKEYVLSHGSVVIAAITSCTNTSNPSVMLGAGILAKKAVEKGLSVAPYVKTSISPGSGVVTFYLNESGVTPYLEKLGYDIVGYGCMTCIGNSGPLPEPVVEAIDKGDLVACGVLSGNRNFEGRVHPNTRANYLASPILVIAYALAGTVDIDFEKEPIGRDADGKEVYLREIWPSREEIQEMEQQFVLPAMFKQVYSKIESGNERWNSLPDSNSLLYPWDPNSTYIKSPPYFTQPQMTRELPKIESITNARVLVNMSDSVTTDHISPAGSIARNSPAAKYLQERGIVPAQFNSYGSRRGNDEVMSRGTFANIRLVNKFVEKQGPTTIHIPSGEEMSIFDAAQRYKQEGTPLVILTGKEYGCGSSRDWAAKGPLLLGVRAVIAESYERIHRSNLIGMGIVPIEYLPGQNATSLGLTGMEVFNIEIPEKIALRQRTTIKLNDGRTFEAIMRFDTEVELEYFKNGGILHYMLRQLLDGNK